MTTEGIGYAHTMDPPRSPRQPKDRKGAISERWTTRWEPWAAAASKVHLDPAGRFSIFKNTHDMRCITALNAGLAWTTILRSEIDCPINSDSVFSAMLRLSVERRRSRMNRRKGYGKKYDKPRKRKDNT